MSTTNRSETTAPNSYVIQFQLSSGNALTASSASAGATINLMPLQGAGSPTQTWVLDPTSGLITLASTFGTLIPLVLDIQGTNPSGQTPLALAPYVLGRSFQTWNFVGSPPNIISLGLPGFCIDCYGCQVAPSTVIQAYPLNVGDRCQYWTLTSVPVLARALERAQHA